MRFEGKPKFWSDDRGFGFIESTRGGQENFVHVKASKTRDGRPQIDEVFSFEIELGPQGKRRARAGAVFIEFEPINVSNVSRSRLSGGGFLWFDPAMSSPT